MYEQHFGLKKRLFRTDAAGSDVFIGPQSAPVMAALKKALAADDSVITVSGPAGVGKTTVARKTLDSIGKNRVVVTIGRLQLGHDEIIELLLAGVGARQMPRSTIHRFAIFRRLLQQHAENGMRVFIVVEDATRLGIDALSELEALTAEDAGVSNGASLVLMGASGIKELLREPHLARLKQRVKLRQSIQPLTASELQAYLKHWFRQVGGEFETIFEPGAADAIHRFSVGVPRVANNIVEQALTSVMEQGLSEVSVDQIERTAAEEIGLTSDHNLAEIEDAIAEAESIADHPETLRQPEAEPEAPVVDEPVAAVEELATETPATETDDDEIPELIQDTLPDLAILSPKLAEDSASEPEPEPEPESRRDLEPESDQDEDDLPTLSSSMRLEQPDLKPDLQTETEPPESGYSQDPAKQPIEDDVPEWERDPTLAQLRPDLDALERAMAVAQGGEFAEDEEPADAVDDQAVEEPSVVVPEITLDKQIQAKIEEASEALKQAQTDATGEAETEDEAEEEEDQSAEASMTSAESVPVEPHAVAGDESKPDKAAVAGGPQKDKAQIDKIAAGLSRAKTIEDVDDQMAETLFGEEFSAIAAQVAASVPDSSPANDDGLQIEEDALAEAAPVGNLEGAAAVKVEPQAVAPDNAQGDADSSPSQRLATVRALNDGAVPDGAPVSPENAESIVMSEDGASISAAGNGKQPQSIEDQINTSITQTVKALDIGNLPKPDNDDDEPKGGFFSRFRRS